MPESRSLNMDQQSIIRAIREAAPSVALGDAGSPGVETGVRVTDVPAFSRFVDALSSDRLLGTLDGKFLAADITGGFSGPVRVSKVAEFLLAQFLLGKDIVGVVRDLEILLSTNRGTALLIMSIRGIYTGSSVPLAPGIRLSQLVDLPPSLPRSLALGESTLHRLSSGAAIASWAIVTSTEVGPIFVSKEEQEKLAKTQRHRAAIVEGISLLTEAKNCFVLLGLQPLEHISWLHLTGPAAFIEPSSWTTSLSDVSMMTMDQPLNLPACQQLFSIYFSIPRERRDRALRVPLDRLMRAVRQYDATDSAIDLGIAFEALLLHDQGEKTELSFRLRLRGAHLLGGDLATRKQTFELLTKVYNLRSRAVHAGHIGPEDEKARSVLRDGASLCTLLIRRVIEKKGEIAFDDMMLDPSLSSE